MDTLLTTTAENGRVHEVARARVFRLDPDGAIYDRGQLIARFSDGDLLVDAAGDILENPAFRALDDSCLSAHLGAHEFTTAHFTLVRVPRTLSNGNPIGSLVCLLSVGGGLVAKANGFVWRDDVRKVKDLFICDYDLDLEEPYPLAPAGPRSRLSPLASRLG